MTVELNDVEASLIVAILNDYVARLNGLMRKYAGIPEFVGVAVNLKQRVEWLLDKF